MKKILMVAILCSIVSIAFCQQQKQQGSKSSNNDRVSDDAQWEPYPAGKTSEYKATALNTNFTIPLIRFNSTTGDPSMKGSVSLFNSIGAGFGINWGRMEVTTDNNGKIINTEMNNTFGINLGVLFAANTNNDNTQNIFAPTLSVSILNFQVGYGMELGTVAANQKRGFVTVAYNIPISKLLKGGFYLLRRSKRNIDANNTTNPSQTPPLTPANNNGSSRFM
ncbi:MULTISPECIES: hypothetical protein [unclassified Mucilaginibacter]|uniref:hypothetical protein n=1 Tax=unclassified Mucilaginibacter TaxID=2617802 RepID=UPI0009692C88|nr:MULTISPECIES: hypothetical protein [unclassified Mucilaginibacter]OJW14966.1 MAG: hypothetical protein BGO48_12440 [Mucilaginibacter sp. 44-25]PLW88941.1 MAG: hypothetical protein C0154_14060 [Mucilaginibacter sp.]HEK20139.1 hypothetical protein [Bacteroidota bacterium]